MNPSNESRTETGSTPGRRPLPKLRWYESWIIRAAMVAAFVIMCGYVTSAIISIQSIESISRLAHQEDIESTLGDHLNNIKKAHNLQRQLFVEKLRPLAEKGYNELQQAKDGDQVVLDWLTKAELGTMTNLAEVEINRLTGNPGDFIAPIFVWQDRDKLRIYNYVVEFPKGPLYDAFKAAEDVRYRYKVIGEKLEDSIQPTLIQYNSLILLTSFILLASIFFLLAQRFRAKTQDVITGFLRWSEADEMFRFDESFTGELQLITRQFNAMADEVAANKRRSLYLEKIASWQIIARKLAHEIKNPLTPIQMMVSQLTRRYKGDDESFRALLQEAQAIITEEVAALRRMVDNFSNFARLPAPEPKPTDLVHLCHHVVELQRAAFPNHEINFEATGTEIIAPVDEPLIRQVLLNLIKNAAEASWEREARIDVIVETEPGTALIKVCDDGPGIPAELRDRVFEAYFTTKHTGPAPGMGLGLAVCQKIVIDHGGKMLVSSEPGTTVFSIVLPRP